MPPTASASAPVLANYPSSLLTIGAGVAIFHLRTQRVVVCYHTREKHWFLPKGRKNANESVERAAEREGFEETGYRNRLLPIALQHAQTDPDEGHEDYVTEAVWMQLLPLTARRQYVLFWFAAETVTPAQEEAYRVERRGQDAAGPSSRAYVPPEAFPKHQTLRERIDQDVVVHEDGTSVPYEPAWHEGTGVNEDELCYRSFLLPIEEACKKLRGSVMEDVVRRGWEGIQQRIEMETRAAGTAGREDLTIDISGTSKGKVSSKC